MSYQDEMASALATFVVEGRELLEEMESALLGLEEVSGDPSEILNAVFRAAHTMKGSSGLFGLDHMVRFTHVMESVLDRLRTNEIAVSSKLIGALLPCRDHLASLMDGIADGVLEETPEQSDRGGVLLAALQPFLHSAGGTADGTGADADGPATAGTGGTETIGAVRDGTGADGTGADGIDADGIGAGGDDGSGYRNVHLSLRFGADCLRNGMDPLSFIRYLSTLGEVVRLTTVADLLPDAAQMDPETCYLDFEVTLRSDAPVVSIEDVFDFVRDDSTIHVLDAGSSPSRYADLVTSFGELGERIAGILVSTGAVSEPVLRAALAGEPDPSAAPGAGTSTGATTAGGNGTVTTGGAKGGAVRAAAGKGTVVKAGAGKGTIVKAGAGKGGARAGAGPVAVGRQASAPPIESSPTGTSASASGTGRRAPAEPKARETRSIRIDAPRLDRLIDVVGELVIAGASAGLQASHSRDEALTVALGEVMRLVEEVRDSALQLRMVPIGTTFSRFQRVVRDVSADIGKDITLVISGGDTEVDKALVEQIGDPLMHLVRNSMDHGIEPADVRVARGKPPRGTLRLNAFHDSGSIVIEVTDDGGGIDPDRVLAKAIERGLVDPGANLTEQEVFGLVFEPGFSTADAVSDLSGRGVGMDVVKRNVSALRGTIDVDSRTGQGCTMRIRLPLTLAIIDGFLVGVGGATFVVPLDRVIECVEVPTGSAARDCMDLRGEVLPFIRLRSLFGITGERPRRENVVVVEYAGMKVGLVVDGLMGEFQTVIKPLGRLFEHVHGIGGSTILGNGDVALIIDVPMLVRHYGDRHGAQLVTSAKE